MIRQHFGLTRDPFIIDHPAPLLAHQQLHFDILKVHSQQGGFCLILGEPGTGKTTLKHAILHHDQKNWITPVINRSLHTWTNILRLLCQAFDLESEGRAHKCENRLVTEARALNTKGKQLITIIDDAHLIPIEALRKLRLLLEDFPKNHNLILIAQPALNTTLQLRPNNDLKSRITYSAKLELLTAAHLTDFIQTQLDQVGLHTPPSPNRTRARAAINLITRSSEGALRAVKNLCIGSMIESDSRTSRPGPHQNHRPQTSQRCPPPAPLASQPNKRTHRTSPHPSKKPPTIIIKFRQNGHRPCWGAPCEGITETRCD